MNARKSAKPFYILIFVLSFTTHASGFNLSPSVQVNDENQVHLGQFDMMTAESGWVLLDQRLFWTSNAGRSWDEISPSIPSDTLVQDVEFIDVNTGWMLFTTAVSSDDGALFQLAQTTDGGATWMTRALSLFASGEIASFLEGAEMGWFDAQTGWVSVKQVSGSNFSIGMLFTTSDGGVTWSRSALPIADKIIFNDPQTGWAVGGPSGDQIFRTRDAGATWLNVRPDNIPANAPATVYAPFYSNGQGLLVATELGSGNSLNVYALENSSDKWLPVDKVRLNNEPGLIGLSILDTQNFVATIPGTSSIVRMMDGKFGLMENTDGLSESIVELDMTSLDIGWAKWVDSTCSTGSLPNDQTGPVSCSFTTRLLQTTDGGITWQSIRLPLIQADMISRSFSYMDNQITATNDVSSLDNTNVFIGQGFDKCEIPTLSQMQTWSGNSPYDTVNLYIGGSSRACNNTALNSNYLKQLHQQGWKFIPTWVGPQAPCTGYISRMSSDIATAYNQGINEANLAVERLAELGLTYPNKSGSVVYYDIEYYGTDTACRDAVNSFMNGWVSQLHTRENLAGVYGSTLCNTALSDFRFIANVPDVIWPARWYHNLGEGDYDPDASVWNLGSCLPNNVWANHQRIRQYEGDHNETWGNLTLGIDSNVLDGVVALPYIAPVVNSILRTDPSPTSANSIDFTVIFSEGVTGVDISDFTLTTVKIARAVITNVSGSNDTYTVTVDTGTCSGTVRLDLIDDDSIKNSNGNPLNGMGTGNGNFFNGETYTIEKQSNTDIFIGEANIGCYDMSNGDYQLLNYPGTSGGPLFVENTNLDPIVSSMRLLYKNSKTETLSELMGVPTSQLSNDYWMPFYADDTNHDSQIRFTNTHDTLSTTVNVYLGDNPTPVDSIVLGPQAADRVTLDNTTGGPLHIESTTAGVNILAGMRIIYKGNSSFDEIMALPTAQLDDEYWFPFYNHNNVNLFSEVRVGNPSETATNVDIYIGDTLMDDNYPLPARGYFLRSYPGTSGGPIRVVSDDGTNIIASMRLLYKNSKTETLSELMGVPTSQLSNDYWMPFYADDANHDSQIRFTNTHDTLSTTVNIYLGDNPTPVASIALGPQAADRVTLDNTTGGPLRIESTTAGVNILAGMRIIYKGNSSFDEIMALPTAVLDDEYWFPFYNHNNVNLFSEVRIGVPNIP